MRKIRYVRDNMPARVRDMRKGRGTYTAGGIEGSGAFKGAAGLRM